MLNPGQGSFLQFLRTGLHRFLELDAVEPLAREAFPEVSRIRLQRFHSGAPALLTKQSRLMGIVKGRLRAKRRCTRSAAVKPRQPTTKPYGPETKVAQGQSPVTGALNFPGRQQDQTEHGLGDFMLRQNQLRHSTDHRQPRAEPVIALRLVKGLEQLSLLDAHEFPGLLLHVPNLDVRENLERRAVAVLDAAGPGGHAAHASGRASEKTHQAVRLAQWKCLQDDGFRFPGRHELSARRRCVEPIVALCPNRTHTQNYCNYHTRSRRAIFTWKNSQPPVS